MDKPAVRKPTVKKPSNAGRSAAAKPAIGSHKKPKKEKKDGHKVKVIRDSFTMPQADYYLIALLKLKGTEAGLHVKKSELLRAGLQVLSKLSPVQLKRVLTGIEKIKTGRPKMSA